MRKYEKSLESIYANRLAFCKHVIQPFCKHFIKVDGPVYKKTLNSKPTEQLYFDLAN